MQTQGRNIKHAESSNRTSERRDRFQVTLDNNLRRIENRLNSKEDAHVRKPVVLWPNDRTCSRCHSQETSGQECFRSRSAETSNRVDGSSVRTRMTRSSSNPGMFKSSSHQRSRSQQKQSSSSARESNYKPAGHVVSRSARAALPVAAAVKDCCCERLCFIAGNCGKVRTCLIQNDDGSYERKSVFLVTRARHPVRYGLPNKGQEMERQCHCSSFLPGNGCDTCQNIRSRNDRSVTTGVTKSHSDAVYCSAASDYTRSACERSSHCNMKRSKRCSADSKPRKSKVSRIFDQLCGPRSSPGFAADEKRIEIKAVTSAPQPGKAVRFRDTVHRREMDTTSIASSLAKSFLCGTCFEMDGNDDSSSSLDSENGSGDDDGSDSGGDDGAASYSDQFDDFSDLDAIEYISVDDGDGSGGSSVSDKHSTYDDEILQDEEMDLLRFMHENEDDDPHGKTQPEVQEDYSLADEEERLRAYEYSSYIENTYTYNDSTQGEMDLDSIGDLSSDIRM